MRQHKSPAGDKRESANYSVAATHIARFFFPLLSAELIPCAFKATVARDAAQEAAILADVVEDIGFIELKWNQLAAGHPSPLYRVTAIRAARFTARIWQAHIWISATNTALVEKAIEAKGPRRLVVGTAQAFAFSKSVDIPRI
jgi:hypothetical protein